MGKPGLPEWAVRLAYKLIDVEKSSPIVDERVQEYSFAISKLAKLPVGRLLDVGCVARVNLIPATFCELGWEVHGVDIRPYSYEHPNFTFVQEGILDYLFHLNYFTAITAISTIEHIGVSGRYGIREGTPEGDKLAVKEIRDILKRDGRLILTVPFGLHKKSSLGRVYDKERLTCLCQGWKVLDRRVIGNLAMLELQK